MDAAYFFLEAIHARRAFRHHRPDTVFREPTRVDAQLPQERQNRRGHAAVAFEFDDHRIGKFLFATRFVVDESQSEINGQAFRFLEVHERDAMEAVADGGVYLVEGEVSMFLEELLALTLLQHRFERFDLDALFVGAAVVVFFLDFEEGVAAVDVSANAHFHSGPRIALMGLKHRAHGVVEVGGGVGAKGNVIDALCVIVSVGHLEQLGEFIEIGNKLRVRTLHEAYGLHFVDRDGR